LPYCLRDESQLLDKDWKVIELFGCVHDDFESTLLNIEGDGIACFRKGGKVRLNGSMWDVAQAFEFLLTELENGSRQLKTIQIPSISRLISISGGRNWINIMLN
jgi:hypothetical protein